ncbi:MAG: hypothetical protein H6739_41540 [Alphaproteobacteria bacterium]|nr:hypothetical protein [Alphaproteobacteria bacterium]
MKRLAFALAAIVLGTLAAVAIGEAWARLAQPPLRAQVMRPAEWLTVRAIDGVPVWRSAHGSAARENADCQGDARVVLLGSSILYGSGLQPEESPGVQLQAALRARGVDACVHNHAQPGFTFQTQAAVASEVLPALRPQLVLWEIWENSPTTFAMAGDTAYNLHGLRVGSDGLPWLGGVPAGLNTWLLPRSRLYELLALDLAPETRPNMAKQWQDFAVGALRAGVTRVRAAGARPAFVLAPRLERPFAEQVAAPSPVYDPAVDLAERDGVPWTRLETLLADQSVEALRQDSCCHYNPAGAEAVGERLAGWIVEQGLLPSPR